MIETEHRRKSSEERNSFPATSPRGCSRWSADTGSGCPTAPTAVYLGLLLIDSLSLSDCLGDCLWQCSDVVCVWLSYPSNWQVSRVPPPICLSLSIHHCWCVSNYVCLCLIVWLCLDGTSRIHTVRSDSPCTLLPPPPTPTAELTLQLKYDCLRTLKNSSETVDSANVGQELQLVTALPVRPTQSPEVKAAFKIPS